MGSICELEERHGTNLGSGYENDHSCAVAKQWSNILALMELLFCLPVGNGGLERVFLS